jgi:DNA (cytosine-5)-methyltransferase 1
MGSTMKVIDLFSGIGGFSLGLEAVGFQTVQFVEQDPFCQKVLKHHWPHVPIHSDIRTFDGKRHKDIGLVCGGFPCQPFSVANAGRQRGVEDDRYLWPQMFRTIQDVKARYVLGENVSGIINLALDQVYSDLETSYEITILNLPALAADALHRRERIFIIGVRKDLADSRCVNGGERNSTGMEPDKAIRPSCNVHLESGCEGQSDLADSGSIRFQHNTKKSVLGQPDLQRKLERGGSDKKIQRTNECRVGHLVDGISRGLARFEWPEEKSPRLATNEKDRGQKLKGLGNAVVPPLIAKIGSLIMNHNQNG